MSDLRPIGTPVKIGGQEYNFLFTIGIIETVQEECNQPLVEIISGIARVANYGTEIKDIYNFHTVVAAFVAADTGKKVEPEEIDGVIRPAEMQKVAIGILKAYGFSMPESEEDDDEEDEDPKQKTGQ